MAAEYFDCSSSGQTEDIHQKYTKLLNNEFLSDVTFIIGENSTRVYGHSFVLMLCNWDFYNIFKLLKLDKYEFIIKDVPESSFLAFLKYCYTFTLVLTEDTSLDKTMDILKLSQSFHMKTLEVICLNHLITNLSIMKCMKIYRHRALFPPDSSVLNTALFYTGQYFLKKDQIQKDMIIFLELPLEALMEIQKERCFINYDEKEWFDILIRWAKRACEMKHIPSIMGANLRMVFGDLLHKIRFSAMKANCFLDIIANYPGLLTTEEILKISNDINEHTVDCPGFDPVPQLTYDSNSRVVLFGNTIQCFTGPPKMDQGLTDEMTSSFSVGGSTALLGFAFIAKKNEVVNVTSFKLIITCFLSEPFKNIITYPAGRYQFNENYDLIAMRLQQEYKIYSYYTVDLHCKFDKPVPNLSSGKVDFHQVQNNIYCDINVINAIPYLIFSH